MMNAPRNARSHLYEYVHQTRVQVITLFLYGQYSQMSQARILYHGSQGPLKLAHAHSEARIWDRTVTEGQTIFLWLSVMFNPLLQFCLLDHEIIVI